MLLLANLSIDDDDDQYDNDDKDDDDNNFENDDYLGCRLSLAVSIWETRV